MRVAVLALAAVATGGCNSIFGLNDVAERDARTVDAEWWPMQLTWQIVEGPTGPTDFPPIDGATVELGPIDVTQPLTPVALESDGSFRVPIALAKDDYRLVYTVDGLPTEIQSKLTAGHFVVPIVGRLDRGIAPSFTHLLFAPPNKSGAISGRILTIGLWTSTILPEANHISVPYTYGYYQFASSMNGRLGSLEAAPGGDATRGDLEVLAEVFDGDVQGYARMSVDQLYPNPPGPDATAPSTWIDKVIDMVPPVTLKTTPPNGAADPYQRLLFLTNSTMDLPISEGGVIPSSQIANFLEPSTNGSLDGVQLAPLSIAYAPTHTFVNPFADLATDPYLPTAVYTQDTTHRTVGALTLTSGFQGVSLVQDGNAQPVNLAYDVGIAHAIGHDVALTPVGGDATATTWSQATAGEGDTLVLGGAPVLDLTFGTDQHVDDCVTTLYLVAGAMLTPVRRMLHQEAPITTPFHLNTDVFARGQTYVLGVVCRQGLPGIAVGDYSQVTYPYQTSTVYTHTFVVQDAP